MRSETGFLQWYELGQGDGRVTCLTDWHQIRYTVSTGNRKIHHECKCVLTIRIFAMSYKKWAAFRLRPQPRKNSGQCVSAPEVIWSSRVPQRLGHPFGSPVVWHGKIVENYGKIGLKNYPKRRHLMVTWWSVDKKRVFLFHVESFLSYLFIFCSI